MGTGEEEREHADGRWGFVHRLEYYGIPPAVCVRWKRGTKTREFTHSAAKN